MNWQPNVGEKPEGWVLIWDGRYWHTAKWIVQSHRWMVVDDRNFKDEDVTHWMKVEAPK